jgi:hypothetical protein
MFFSALLCVNLSTCFAARHSFYAALSRLNLYIRTFPRFIVRKLVQLALLHFIHFTPLYRALIYVYALFPALSCVNLFNLLCYAFIHFTPLYRALIYFSRFALLYRA